MRDIPEQVVSILERYTGEAEPNCEKPRDKSLQSCSIATIRNEHSPKRRFGFMNRRFAKFFRRKSFFFRRLREEDFKKEKSRIKPAA